MKDDRGRYYFPFPQNKRVRMYVRKVDTEIEFRLWNQDDLQLWESHGWVPYDAVIQASSMYAGKAFNPSQTYDLTLAKETLDIRE